MVWEIKAVSLDIISWITILEQVPELNLNYLEINILKADDQMEYMYQGSEILTMQPKEGTL